jgi:ketosteroid isomerase-like protein
MSVQREATERIARQVRIAYEAADLSAFSDLLDPNVRWGAPDDPSPSCHNRKQVLAWYQRARESGLRAHVSEVVTYRDRVIVGLTVAGRPAAREAGGEAERWQVLTIRGGRIVDIVAFNERSEAVARAGRYLC